MVSAQKSSKEEKTVQVTEHTIEDIGTDFNFKHQYVWKNVFGYLIFHILGVIGIYIYFTFKLKWQTMIYIILFGSVGGMGVTMGAHRYFTHRCFKAKIFMRRFLMMLFVMNGQNNLWEWVRDHRQHHKYADTDADPHNAKRGLFFSHVGWLLSRKHPHVIKYGKGIDMSDMNADSWVMYQKRHFIEMYLVVAIFIPCIIPIVFWNEDPLLTFLTCYIGRTVYVLQVTWFVNSLAHFYGTKPYDKNILSVESKFVSMFSYGEGWHNYHHAFPYDYRTAELGMPNNVTAKVIDFCAKYGWVYDLKVPKEESIRNRVRKTGDNSHKKYGDPTKYPGIETWKNIWVHPNNPTYTTKKQPNNNNEKIQ